MRFCVCTGFSRISSLRLSTVLGCQQNDRNNEKTGEGRALKRTVCYLTVLHYSSRQAILQPVRISTEIIISMITPARASQVLHTHYYSVHIALKLTGPEKRKLLEREAKSPRNPIAFACANTTMYFYSYFHQCFSFVSSFFCTRLLVQ